jgi:hypothetical protein
MWEQLLYQLVDLDEILYGDDDIEGDLDSIILNPLASTISKWWTFKYLRWVQVLNLLVDLDKILYGVMALSITSTKYYLIPYL